MQNIIERLKQLEAAVHYEIPGEGPKAGYSPCDDIRFKEALTDAWPKLLDLFVAVKECRNHICGLSCMLPPGCSAGMRIDNAIAALK